MVKLVQSAGKASGAICGATGNADNGSQLGAPGAAPAWVSALLGDIEFKATLARQQLCDAVASGGSCEIEDAMQHVAAVIEYLAIRGQEMAKGSVTKSTADAVFFSPDLLLAVDRCTSASEGA